MRKAFPVAGDVQTVAGTEEGVQALHVFGDTVSLLPWILMSVTEGMLQIENQTITSDLWSIVT